MKYMDFPFIVVRDDGWVSSRHRTKKAAEKECARMSKIYKTRGTTFTVQERNHA